LHDDAATIPLFKVTNQWSLYSCAWKRQQRDREQTLERKPRLLKHASKANLQVQNLTARGLPSIFPPELRCKMNSNAANAYSEVNCT